MCFKCDVGVGYSIAFLKFIGYSDLRTGALTFLYSFVPNYNGMLSNGILNVEVGLAANTGI